MVNLMAKNPFTTESVEFDTPANRIIQQLQPKNQFRIDTSLPDLAFLRQLSVQGRLTFNTLDVNDTGTLSITPNTGETQFIYQVIFNSNLVGNWTVQILNNDIERAKFRVNASTGDSKSFTFNVLDSLVGDSIKSIDVILTRSSGTSSMTATVLGWKENTSRIRDVTT